MLFVVRRIPIRLPRYANIVKVISIEIDFPNKLTHNNGPLRFCLHFQG